MSRGHRVLIAAVLGGTITSAAGQGAPSGDPLAEDPDRPPVTLAIGSPAPDFALTGVDGKVHGLADYAGADVLMLVFTCNHCPDAQLAEEPLKQIVNDYREKSFILVAISSNSPLGIRPDELGFSVHGDSLEDMSRHAEDNGFNFPYLYDGDTQEVGRAYGALSTPHCFIFDRERRVRYIGRVNNLHHASDELTETPARDAIDALLAGLEVPTAVTRAFGCSIKWSFKREAVAADERAWRKRPVTLETIGAKAVRTLAANGTKKLRLFNVWSSTCGPCIGEMPELVMVNRNYQNRPFELITVSIDPPERREAALAILRESHAALGRTASRSIGKEGRKSNNYLWQGGSLDALAEALDTEWPGTLPYTVLIAPGGKILYRRVGAADITELRHAIVAHLGRYW